MSEVIVHQCLLQLTFSLVSLRARRSKITTLFLTPVYGLLDSTFLHERTRSVNVFSLCIFIVF